MPREHESQANQHDHQTNYIKKIISATASTLSMSGRLGQKQTFHHIRLISALPRHRRTLSSCPRCAISGHYAVHIRFAAHSDLTGTRTRAPTTSSPPRSFSALAQGDERIEDQSIEGQALAKRTFAGAKCPIRRDADFVDARLAWRRFDPVNQLRHLPIENICRPDEVGPKGDEQIAVVALLLRAGPGEQSQRLYHQRQPEAFVAAER